VITAEQALEDFNKGDQQQGQMFCFCKANQENDTFGNFIFSDGSKHCQ